MSLLCVLGGYLSQQARDQLKNAVQNAPRPRLVSRLGDQANDLFMFDRAGFRIAMGNAPDRVKTMADVVTGTNNEDGFAQAVDRFILGAKG